MDEIKPGTLLSVLQLADSFFPSGIYAHSHGLEGLVNRGMIRTSEDVADFLENQFIYSVMPTDGVALLEAYRAAELADLNQIISIDQLLIVMKPSSEFRTASTQLGYRLLVETKTWDTNMLRDQYSRMVNVNKAPGNGSVVLGVGGSALNMGGRTALAVFAHSLATSILGAAMRLLPFSHTDAQLTLRRLNPLLEHLTAQIYGMRWVDMQAFTPELDLVSMAHETDELRLFAS